MHEKVLPRRSLELLASLGELDTPTLKGWTLAGGTGLALRLGHRRSEDFDFFRSDAMDSAALQEHLRKACAVETLQEEPHTLSVLADGVKLSFFRVADDFLFPAPEYRFFRLADTIDIGLMKLVAISGRGSRRDFVDLYTILRGGPTLEELFDLLPKRYGKGRANSYHILKSLTYFEDAESEPMPEMLEPFDWSECREFFLREAHALALP